MRRSSSREDRRRSGKFELVRGAMLEYCRVVGDDGRRRTLLVQAREGGAEAQDCY